MSSISPVSSRELHDRAAKLGIDVMDVAISGSTPAAGQGTLTLLVGGNAELFKAAQIGRELHDRASKLGIDVMDFAISGSTPAAGQGTLTLLVGGNAELFKAA